VIRVRLTEDEYTLLRQAASSKQVTISELVRRALASISSHSEDHDQEPSDQKAEDASLELNEEDKATIMIADRLVTMLAMHSRDIITFDQVRAYLKTIKPAIYPIMEQNVVYLLQGLGILKPLGSVPLITDVNRRVGLFRIDVSEEVLFNGVASALRLKHKGPNGHTHPQANSYIPPFNTYRRNDPQEGPNLP